MDINENGVICSKNRLWKKPNLVLEIVDYMISKGYTFKEMVFGEPRDFVFADEYEEIIPTLKRKGGYFGIRIKFEKKGCFVTIDSNTDGVNNVKYSIFAENEESLNDIRQTIMDVVYVIKPTNESVMKSAEWLQTKPWLVRTIIAVLLVIILYFLGVHVFVFSAITYIVSFIPSLLFFYFLYYIFTRRR